MSNDTKVSRRKPADKTADNNKTQGRSVRWSDGDWKRISNAARVESLRSGFPVAGCDIIRKFTLAGLGEWEKGEARAKQI